MSVHPGRGIDFHHFISVYHVDEFMILDFRRKIIHNSEHWLGFIVVPKFKKY